MSQSLIFRWFCMKPSDQVGINLGSVGNQSRSIWNQQGILKNPLHGNPSTEINVDPKLNSMGSWARYLQWSIMILHARIQAMGKEGTIFEPERHPLAPPPCTPFSPLPHRWYLTSFPLPSLRGHSCPKMAMGTKCGVLGAHRHPCVSPVGQTAGGRGRSKWLMADYRLLEYGTPELKNIYNPGILHPTLGLRMPGVVRTPFASKVLLPGGSLSPGTYWAQHNHHHLPWYGNLIVIYLGTTNGYWPLASCPGIIHVYIYIDIFAQKPGC